MPAQAHLSQPLHTFSDCHMGFVAQLHAALELPQLVRAASRSRTMAADLVKLFERGVIGHHDEEERELFPAVQRSAKPGEEADRVNGMVDQLIAEHRNMERLWKMLEPQVRSAARGEGAELSSDLLEELVQAFFAHAHYEEELFLPLAEQILGRDSNHMAALGLSLHMRHVEPPVGYI